MSDSKTETETVTIKTNLADLLILCKNDFIQFVRFVCAEEGTMLKVRTTRILEMDGGVTRIPYLVVIRNNRIMVQLPIPLELRK